MSQPLSYGYSVSWAGLCPQRKATAIWLSIFCWRSNQDWNLARLLVF